PVGASSIVSSGGREQARQNATAHPSWQAPCARAQAARFDARGGGCYADCTDRSGKNNGRPTMRSAHQLATACVCLALSQGGVALAQSGALTQLPGTDACVSEDGTGGACAEGVALSTAVGVAVTADGRN